MLCKCCEIVMSELTPTERAQQQTTSGWLTDYDAGNEIRPTSQHNIDPKPNILQFETNRVPEDIRKAGIVSIRHAGDRLLITSDRPITSELDNRIKLGIGRLAKIAEPDTGETMYEYTGYRTAFYDKNASLALTFREIHTGAIGDRYFNIILKNKDGINFKTRVNGEFRITGNTRRLQEGMFLKFWMDAVKEIPDGRLSHIYRYMNAKLSGVVVSCSNPVPHHEIIKLKKMKYEGHLYQIT